MSQSQVLARKWRPRTFSELTGQEHVVKALSNALNQNRLHHAYLFTGTRGVGKTTLARIFAKALNCETGITPAPCGTCAACLEIDRGHFADLIELDAASNTQVDHMRDLLENALYAPTNARFKIYIIDEVHMLSRSAFNAMLKTLEEPPGHVKFILATTDPQKIPVTVLSRCLQFNLKLIPATLIAEYLQTILIQENIASDTTALEFIARAAQGSMRDALSILDQAIAFGEGQVIEATVREMLGVIDHRHLYELLDALVAKDGKRLLSIATDMESQCLSLDTALQDLASILYRISLAQAVPDAINEDTPEYLSIRSLANAFPPDDIQLLYQITLHGRNDLHLAPDEYTGFTMTLIRMLAFMPDDSPLENPLPARQNSVSTARQNNASATRLNESDTPKIGKSEPAPKTTGANEPAAAGTTTTVIPVPQSWPELVKQLKLIGMAKMLAHHSEAKLLTHNAIELLIPEAHKHLLDKKYQQAIQTAVNTYFSRPIKLSFSIGSITGMTPVTLQQLENEQKQAHAIAAIEKDPIVQDLVDSFDAKIIESSIKPIPIQGEKT
ncbi:MAG: DNA polymerase III subunit gamma/tau [Nitrosomonas sp.]|nr:DNA polymerase III subunit gamma/tau [Nitrosomonas sp.]